MGEGYDAVLFGQVGPTQFDLDQLGARLERDDHALAKASIREVGFLSVVDLLGTYAGQATDLQDWVRDAQLNRDRNLRLQYLAGMGYNSFVESEILSEIMQHYEFPDRLIRGSEALKEALKARTRPRRQLGCSWTNGNPRGHGSRQRSTAYAIGHLSGRPDHSNQVASVK